MEKEIIHVCVYVCVHICMHTVQIISSLLWYTWHFPLISNPGAVLSDSTSGSLPLLKIDMLGLGSNLW
jgi:hypothetical protein